MHARLSGTDSTKTIEWKFDGNVGNAMRASRLLEECSLTEVLSVHMTILRAPTDYVKCRANVSTCLLV